MYENEFYSGSGTNENTSGVFSGAQDNTNQTETSHYTTYETGNTGTFEQTINSAAGEKHPKQGGKGAFFKKVLLSVSLGLFFGLFAGLGFYAVQQGMEVTKQTDGEVAQTSTQMDAKENDQSGIQLANTKNLTVVSSDVSDVVKEVMPAMVSIINNYIETGSFFGQTYTQEQASTGSGIIVAESDTELLIVSNHHVVSDAEKLEVTFIDGSVAEAKIKGMDAEMDLAVIAVELDSLSEETRKEIAVAKLGDSDELELGMPVIAIGNALGYGQSVTNGIVSALDREITLEDGSKGTFIQTNAAINPGNSGGALLNIEGEVIGINSNKIGGAAVEGMGYAIPITSASPIIAELMERQTRDKVGEGESGYLGISLQEVTAQISQMFNMPAGIFVAEVESGSAAEKAGIIKGDIIVNFDGEKISSYSELANVLQYYAAGDTAEITVMRADNGAYVEYVYEITLGKRPKDN